MPALSAATPRLTSSPRAGPQMPSWSVGESNEPPTRACRLIDTASCRRRGLRGGQSSVQAWPAGSVVLKWNRPSGCEAASRTESVPCRSRIAPTLVGRNTRTRSVWVCTYKVKERRAELELCQPETEGASRSGDGEGNSSTAARTLRVPHVQQNREYLQVPSDTNIDDNTQYWVICMQRYQEGWRDGSLAPTRFRQKGHFHVALSYAMLRTTGQNTNDLTRMSTVMAATARISMTVLQTCHKQEYESAWVGTGPSTRHVGGKSAVSAGYWTGSGAAYRRTSSADAPCRRLHNWCLRPRTDQIKLHPSAQAQHGSARSWQRLKSLRVMSAIDRPKTLNRTVPCIAKKAEMGTDARYE
ncbi:hypothetical protein RJ55_08626 [Drechmeria coniospora]|nr:hypothetical protein RJ55_08626 [Drechmeria coniospora]